jgi:hypothetical protein
MIDHLIVSLESRHRREADPDAGKSRNAQAGQPPRLAADGPAGAVDFVAE